MGPAVEVEPQVVDLELRKLVGTRAGNSIISGTHREDEGSG